MGRFSDDPAYIPLLENIKEILKGTIYETPVNTNIKKSSKKKAPKTK